jgi:DNA-binding beta-propeller fold protein YncE
VLPQLRKIEERFPEEAVVIGVHSGTYHAERDTARIRDASIRLGVTHPVVNDRQFRVWRSFAVNAWPTLVVVDPAGYVAGQHAGEFTLDAITPFVERTIAAAESAGTLRRERDDFEADSPSIAPGVLRYPTKVAVDGARIAIADSGNHRVLLGRLSDDGLSARVERVVGGNAGFADGGGPRFRSPQGLIFADDMLLVADAGNHAIRRVDPQTGETRTIAGTGEQLRTMRDMRAGALSSPWDLARVGDRVLIAMAGSHELWSMQLEGGDLRVHAGNRSEAIIDGPNTDAALAQPMGIATDGDRIYFADAESSAVRASDADPDGEVRTIVGTGLFDFGDVDGAGDDVRLQHAQGVARDADGRLLIADSYNDALKWIEPQSRRATTWLRELHEPAGLAVADRLVYVADTNAHRVAVIHRERGLVGDLALEGIA